MREDGYYVSVWIFFKTGQYNVLKTKFKSSPRIKSTGLILKFMN